MGKNPPWPIVRYCPGCSQKRLRKTSHSSRTHGLLWETEVSFTAM